MNNHQSNKDSISFWHGAKRWEGLQDFKSTKGAKSLHGPGLYLTTAVQTAAKYCKGGGKFVLIELDTDIKLLEQTSLSLEELLEGLSTIPRVKNRKEIIAGLEKARLRHADNQMPAMYLVNWLVNHDSVGGESGVALSTWLCSKGIDASLCNPKFGEDWLLVFNTQKIKQAKSLTSKQAYEIGDFPTYQKQLEEIPVVELNVDHKKFLEKRQKFKIG